MRTPPPQIEPLNGAENRFGYVDDASYVKYNPKFLNLEIRNSRRHLCWCLQPANIDKVQRISPQEFVVFHSECPTGFRDVTVFYFPRRIESEYAYYELVELTRKHSALPNKEVLT